MQDFDIIIFRSMQLNDTKIQEFGKNDGIQSVLHCQEKFSISESNLMLLTFECMLRIYALTRFYFLMSCEVEARMHKIVNMQ